MKTAYIKKYRYEIMLVLLILAACFIYILFLFQLDYVVYDHGQWNTARMAIEGHWLLKDGQASDFITGMFGCRYNTPRYPNFSGYAVALICYLLGLNEVVMRYATLLCYLILIIYIYFIGLRLDSKKTGVLAVLIAVTIPTLVFWSRMMNGFIFGAAFFTMAFYHLLMSGFFRRCGHSILFGLCTGLLLISHRAMIGYAALLWVIVVVLFINEQRKAKYSIRGFLFAIITFCAIAASFFRIYLRSGDPTLGNPIHPIQSVISFTPSSFIQLAASFGYDNCFIILLIIIANFRILKGSRFRDKYVSLLLKVTIITFSIFAMAEYFIHQGDLDSKYYSVLAPLVAVLIAIYLKSTPPIIRRIFIFIKCLLIVSLFIMIMPSCGGANTLSIFRNYYRSQYMHNGNGVIWSDMTYARKEELDYFRQEISKGDIIIVDSNNGSQSVPLGFRLQANGIGRFVNPSDAKITACYIVFYCISLDDLALCRDCKKDSRLYVYESAPQNLSKIEELINDGVCDALRPEEKLVMIDGYIFLNNIVRYMQNYHFKKVKYFKFRIGKINMYKVIFKCTERASELINFYGYGRERYILRNVQNSS